MKFGTWYNEYKHDVRIHDYFSIMVNNFPILVFRRYDFGLNGLSDYQKCYSLGIIGITFRL